MSNNNKFQKIQIFTLLGLVLLLLFAFIQFQVPRIKANLFPQKTLVANNVQEVQETTDSTFKELTQKTVEIKENEIETKFSNVEQKAFVEVTINSETLDLTITQGISKAIINTKINDTKTALSPINSTFTGFDEATLSSKSKLVDVIVGGVNSYLMEKAEQGSITNISLEEGKLVITYLK